MIAPAPAALALVKPYVETHQIRFVFLAVAVATALIELTGVFRRRSEATHRDGGSSVILRLCTAPGAIVLVLSPQVASAADIHPPLVPVIVGIVLLAAGEALRVWARLTLGRYFTYTVMTSSDQPVITSGPYKVVRHPSYSGALLIAMGIGAAWGNWLGLAAITVATFAGLSYRIHVEEKALMQELGDRYRTFAKEHKRVIPFVW